MNEAFCMGLVEKSTVGTADFQGLIACRHHHHGRCPSNTVEIVAMMTANWNIEKYWSCKNSQHGQMTQIYSD